MPPTDACALRWPNQQCSIDYWVEDCRDVTKAGGVGGGGCGLCTKNGSYCEKEKSQGGGGGQGRCKWRSEAFVKIQKKKFFFLGGGVGGGGGGSG